MVTPVIYCAGPMFAPEEKALNGAIAAELESAGFATFLPHRDGIEVEAIVELIHTPMMGELERMFPGLLEIGQQAVFALNVYQVVERCAALVFNTNGRVPDEGAVIEAGIGFASGKPVVRFRSDVRTLLRSGDNPMIGWLTPPDAVVSEPAAVPFAVRAALERHAAQSQGEGCGPLSARVASVVAFGREVWAFRSVHSFAEPDRAKLAETLGRFHAMCMASAARGAFR